MNDSTLEGYELLYKTRCKKLRDIGLDYSELNEYENFKDILREDVFKDLLRRKQNRKNKRYRYHKAQLKMYNLHLNNIKKGNVVLGTLTIDPEHYNFKERTLRKKVNEWLKKHFIYAIVYDDYGSKNGRLHYHFEGLTTQKMILKEDIKSKKGNEIFEFIEKDYKLGFEPTLVKIDLSKYDMKTSMNYILKLNNHASKSTTKTRFRVIESPLMNLYELKVNR